MIGRDLLEKYLPDFLSRQRWFGAKDRPVEHVEVTALDVLRPAWPALLDALVRVDGETYHIPVGLRPDGEPAGFLHGQEQAMIGLFDTDAGPSFGYDALVDPELGLALLAVVAPDEEAKRVRLAGVEQTNTSLVYDDRLILKVFRRLSEGPNPDVEVPAALAAHGFTSVAAPVATWRRQRLDLAVLQPYLVGATEGWALALTSLRDLYAEPDEPSMAGGDFAAEASRLGQVTAELHVALAEAFGREPAPVERWADAMNAQLERVNVPGLDRGRIRAVFDRLRTVADPGPSIRVHGDYHLAQVLRTDAGWYVLDFEGEPARPLEERRRRSSPLKDVAGMLRSFQYAAQVAMRERDEPEHDETLGMVAAAWEGRNRRAFLEGYFDPARAGGVVPAPEACELVLAAFELDKALYEVTYEQMHRPDWVDIPLLAIARILEHEG